MCSADAGPSEKSPVMLIQARYGVSGEPKRKSASAHTDARFRADSHVADSRRAVEARASFESFEEEMLQDSRDQRRPRNEDCIQ